jgi:hypothetical protein
MISSGAHLGGDASIFNDTQGAARKGGAFRVLWGGLTERSSFTLGATL